MPTYEYKCDACGVFEHFQSITSDPIQECPKCGGKVQKMVVCGMQPIFKGGGFYATDYKNVKPIKPADTPTITDTAKSDKPYEMVKPT
jgi:putative FmdB family regulatory protein